jgi:hypothetical protein
MLRTLGRRALGGSTPVKGIPASGVLISLGLAAVFGLWGVGVNGFTFAGL